MPLKADVAQNNWMDERREKLVSPDRLKDNSMLDGTSHAMLEIQKLEEKFVDSIRKGDIPFLESIFSDNYVFHGSDGSTWGKMKALEDFRNPEYNLQKFEIYNQKIFMHENVAIVTGISIVEGRIGKEILTGRYLFMRVWVQSGGNWKVAAANTSNADEVE